MPACVVPGDEVKAGLGQDYWMFTGEIIDATYECSDIRFSRGSAAFNDNRAECSLNEIELIKIMNIVA